MGEKQAGAVVGPTPQIRDEGGLEAVRGVGVIREGSNGSRMWSADPIHGVSLLEGNEEEQARAENRQLLALRTVLVLERVGAPEALRLLHDLAVGFGDTAVTREAELALTRLRDARTPTMTGMS